MYLKGETYGSYLLTFTKYKTGAVSCTAWNKHSGKVRATAFGKDKDDAMRRVKRML
jgi:hypothetical protein